MAYADALKAATDGAH